MSILYSLAKWETKNGLNGSQTHQSIPTFRILQSSMSYLGWTTLCLLITRFTMGIKMVNFWPSCRTNEQRVSMADPLSSGTESIVLAKGWMIREAKSVRSRESVSLSMVSKEILNTKWDEGYKTRTERVSNHTIKSHWFLTGQDVIECCLNWYLFFIFKIEIYTFW